MMITSGNKVKVAEKVCFMILDDLIHINERNALMIYDGYNMSFVLNYSWLFHWMHSILLPTLEPETWNLIVSPNAFHFIGTFHCGHDYDAFSPFALTAFLVLSLSRKTCHLHIFWHHFYSVVSLNEVRQLGWWQTYLVICVSACKLENLPLWQFWSLEGLYCKFW